VEWPLYAGGVRYVPPVKIKHTKEPSEVFDLDWLSENIDCCNLLLQGPGIYS